MILAESEEAFFLLNATGDSTMLIKQLVEQARGRCLGELNVVQRQILEILTENIVAARCTRDSAPSVDETQGSRAKNRSNILREDSEILEQLQHRERYLKRKLGIPR